MSEHYLERIHTLFTERVRHCRALGMQAVSVDAGRVELRMEYRPFMLGNIEQGLIHGGVLSSFIDTASGMAACTVVAEAERVVTLDLRIDNMRPALRDQTLFARAECYRLTPRIAFIRACAWQDGPERPVAVSQSTFMRLSGTGEAVSS